MKTYILIPFQRINKSVRIDNNPFDGIEREHEEMFDNFCKMLVENEKMECDYIKCKVDILKTFKTNINKARIRGYENTIFLGYDNSDSYSKFWGPQLYRELTEREKKVV